MVLMLTSVAGYMYMVVKSLSEVGKHTTFCLASHWSESYVSLSEIATTHWAGLCFVCTHSSPLACCFVHHLPLLSYLWHYLLPMPYWPRYGSCKLMHVIYSCQCTCTCPMQVFCVYTHVYVKSKHCVFIYMTFNHLISLFKFRYVLTVHTPHEHHPLKEPTILIGLLLWRVWKENKAKENISSKEQAGESEDVSSSSDETVTNSRDKECV